MVSATIDKEAFFRTDRLAASSNLKVAKATFYKMEDDTFRGLSVEYEHMSGRQRVAEFKRIFNDQITNFPNGNKATMALAAAVLKKPAFTSTFDGLDVSDIVEYFAKWPDQEVADKAKKEFLKTPFLLSRLMEFENPTTVKQLQTFFTEHKTEMPKP